MQQADRAHSATGTLASPGNINPIITNVIAFPDNPIAHARRQLRYCRDATMLVNWVKRVNQLRDLSKRDRTDLANRLMARWAEIDTAGVR